MKTYVISRYCISRFDCILMGVCGPQKLNIFFLIYAYYAFDFWLNPLIFSCIIYFPFLFTNFSSPYNDIHPPSPCLGCLSFLVKLSFALLILASLPYFHIRPPINNLKKNIIGLQSLVRSLGMSVYLSAPGLVPLPLDLYTFFCISTRNDDRSKQYCCFLTFCFLPSYALFSIFLSIFPVNSTGDYGKHKWGRDLIFFLYIN